MGRQVGWRTAPEDIREFQYVAERRGWLLLPRKHPEQWAGALPDWASCGSGALVRSQDRKRVIWKQAPAGFWWVDTSNSPVVEFSPGHSSDGAPWARWKAGRMWFATSYLRDGSFVPADPEFVRDAAALLNWPRRVGSASAPNTKGRQPTHSSISFSAPGAAGTIGR